MTTQYIGQPVSRVDGRAKVTGQAKYAADHRVPDLAYGVVVSSSIAKGSITSIDATAATALDGVLLALTHENASREVWLDKTYRDEVAPPGSMFKPLHDDIIRFSGQPVALVVAESFELARYAASLVRISYAPGSHASDLSVERRNARPPEPRPGIEPPKSRGDFARVFARSAVQIDTEYSAPAEHHNPMEPFATTVVWEDDGTLTIHEKTQGARNDHQFVCAVFGLQPADVRVLSPYVGGAFGAGLRPQYQLFLAVMAARQLKRSVKVTLTRQQMFTLGYRPQSLQRVQMGATRGGRLQALTHHVIAATSRFEDYSEPVVQWSGELYSCSNVMLKHEVASLDLNTPCDMRAPGATWGMFALEASMDELAYKIPMDPLELRLKNLADKKDPYTGLKFSSNELRECYRQGAERFGWLSRAFAPRAMRDGDTLIGWGLATGVWEAMQFPAVARAVLTADGKLTVGSATADIGTGTYTIMTQIAAETLGLPIENVTFQLGDSTLPPAPVQGGSFTASTVGSAVKAVCEKVCRKVFRAARKMNDSPIAGARIRDVIFRDGRISLSEDPSRSVSILDAMRFGRIQRIDEVVQSTPSAKQSRYTVHSHSAVFAEVRVDPDLGSIQVSRVVSAIAAGRILNPKTARSQIIGGVVWGIGMALQEESVIDQKFGRFMNHSLGEYHVPVHADIPEIDVIFVEEKDSIVNPLGAKGVGELGIVGTAAAIANAVFHATGQRARNLPITLDKLLPAAAAGLGIQRPAA